MAIYRQQRQNSVQNNSVNPSPTLTSNKKTKNGKNKLKNNKENHIKDLEKIKKTKFNKHKTLLLL